MLKHFLMTTAAAAAMAAFAVPGMTARAAERATGFQSPQEFQVAHCCHPHPEPPYDEYCCHPAASVTYVAPTYVAPAYGWGPASVRGVSRRTARRTSRRVSRRR